jgi:hypothetical protein
MEEHPRGTTMSETPSGNNCATDELQGPPITSDLLVSFASPSFARQQGSIPDSAGRFLLCLFSWLEKFSTWKREQRRSRSAAKDEHETESYSKMPTL